MNAVYSDESLKKLVNKVQNGSREAFGEIFDQYFRRILNYAYKRTLNLETAEDITSQTFTKVLESIDFFEYSHVAAFEGWLFKITENNLKQMWRKNILRNQKIDAFGENVEVIDPEQVDFYAEYQKDEEVKELLINLKKLNKGDQQVISLKYFANLPYLEIAEIMGKTESAVKTQCHRALKKLQHYILRSRKNGK